MNHHIEPVIPTVFRLFLNATIWENMRCGGIHHLDGDMERTGAKKSSKADNQKKRKRVKLQCGVCKRIFDDDYRAEHNKKYHKNYLDSKRLVPYHNVGAPKPSQLFASVHARNQSSSRQNDQNWNNTEVI